MEKHFINRKGQITIFVIIGIVLLFGLSLILYLTGEENAQIAAPSLIVHDVDSLTAFVEACIRDAGVDVVNSVSEHGGSLDTKDSVLYNNYYHKLYCKMGDHGCESTIITKSMIADQIDVALADPLLNCIDLKQFGVQGYSSVVQNMSIETTIGFNDVDIKVNYPIRLTKENKVIDAKDFRANIPHDLGKLHSLAVFIANKEIIEGGFDKEEFMRNHNLIIRKSRPYPYTTYELETRKGRFNFGIDGIRTIENLDQTKRPLKTICFVDGDCFKNVKPSYCDGSLSGSCRNEEEFGDKGIGKNCRYSGITRNHGSTWCGYDNIAGGGRDYPGNRHSLFSCINGEVIREECRDYREQLCTTYAGESACRENRWQTCAIQNNEDDCLNALKRDCRWVENFVDYGGLNTNNDGRRCVPEVPPGFKFWEDDGGVCKMGNEQVLQNLRVKAFGGRYDPPAAWRDSIARYCSSLGDCGSQRNFRDKKGNGFISTAGIASNAAYFEEGFDPTTVLINLPLRVGSSQRLTGNEFNFPEREMEYLLQNSANNLQQIKKTVREAKRKPWKLAKGVNIPILHTSFCNKWQAPESVDCSCDGCSEYQCKSIGSNCVFSYDNFGVGKCDLVQDDENAPVVDIDLNSISVTVDPNNIIGKGYVIGGLQPYENLNFTLVSNEPTRCRINIFPDLGIEKILPLNEEDGTARLFQMMLFPAYQEFIFSENSKYESVHKFDFPVYPLVDIDEAVHQIFEVESLISLAKVEAYENLIDQIYDDAKKISRETGEELSDTTVLYKSLKSSIGEFRLGLEELGGGLEATFRKLIFNLRRGEQTIFFECRDASGNRNDNLYLKYKVLEDTTPPEILDVTPANFEIVESPFELSLELNEPAECTIGEQQMDCVGFRCKKLIDIPEDFVNLNINCKDQPVYIDNFKLDLVNRTEFKILESAYDFGIEQINGGINISDTIAVYENRTKIGITENVKVVINERKSKCRYSEEFEEFEKMSDMNCDDKACTVNLGFGNYNLGCTSNIFDNRNTADFTFTYYKK